MQAAVKLPINASLQEAWQKTSGAKATIWAGLLLTFLLMGVMSFFSQTEKINPAGIFTFILEIVYFLLQLGINYIGILRSRNVPITYSLIFHTFKFKIAWRLMVTYLLQMLIIGVTLLSVIPLLLLDADAHTSSYAIPVLVVSIGAMALVYFSVKMFFAMAFVLDMTADPWTAIKLSFQATRGNFWRLLWLIILQICIIIISIIPLGILLIWTIPFSYVLYGNVYNKLLTNVGDQPTVAH